MSSWEYLHLKKYEREPRPTPNESILTGIPGFQIKSYLKPLVFPFKSYHKDGQWLQASNCPFPQLKDDQHMGCLSRTSGSSDSNNFWWLKFLEYYTQFYNSVPLNIFFSLYEIPFPILATWWMPPLRTNTSKPSCGLLALTPTFPNPY